jgi:tyrosine-specific transport protein
MATRALKNVADQPWVSEIAEYFAFFALVTSFLGVALSLVDFLTDGLQVSKKPSHRLLVTLLALGPPLFFALLYPNLFLWALGIAGGFSAVILFGILPALMVWKGRYQERVESKPLVAGGKPVLVIVILIACGIVVSQLIQELGHLGVFS